MQIPRISAGARLTARLRDAAGRRTGDAGSAVIQAARDLHLSWPTVMEAFRTQARDVTEAPLPRVAVLGIDETRRGRPRWEQDADTGKWRLARNRCHTGFVDAVGHGGLIGQVEGRTGADRHQASHARWKFLTWCADSDIPEVRQFATTLDRWWPETAAFIDTTQQRQERRDQPRDQARRPQRVRLPQRRQPASTDTLSHHPPSQRRPPHRSTWKTHTSTTARRHPADVSPHTSSPVVATAAGCGGSGAAPLNWRASASAFSNSGRTLTRVLIRSEKTLWHSARRRASSWLASSRRAADVRAYPMRTGRSARGAGTTARAGCCFHVPPGAVGRDGDFQFLAERGDKDEARGVVLRGGFPAPGAAGTAGRCVTVRADVTLYRQCCLIGRETRGGSL